MNAMNKTEDFLPQDIKPDEIRMSVARFLKERREAQGFTQKELADRTGIGLSTIKQYERESGGSMPTIEKAARLAEELYFDPRDLFAQFMTVHPMDDFATDQTNDEHDPLADARQAIRAIRNLTEQRGVRAQHLPALLRRSIETLSELGAGYLFELVRSETSLEDVLGEERGPNGESLEFHAPYLEDLQACILVDAIYRGMLVKLSLDDLRDMHRVVAEAMNLQWPIVGVPVRSLLDDFLSSDEADEAMRKQIIRGLSPTLLNAALQRWAPGVTEAEDGTVRLDIEK